MKPKAAREHLGYSVYQLAKMTRLPRTSIRALEQHGSRFAKRMEVLSLLKLFEALFPHATLRDFVGQRCPLEIVPISSTASKKIEVAQIESLAAENRRLLAQIDRLTRMAPRAVAGSRFARGDEIVTHPDL